MKTKVILIMMFVMAGFVVPGWADFTTVGVYDPADGPHWNDADDSGVYSSSAGGASAANVITLATMQSMILAVDPNFGGVVDAEVLRDIVWVNGDRTIRARYGTPYKTVDMTDPGNDIGTSEGFSGSGETPISGNYRFTPGTPGGFTLQMGNIIGDEGERVIAMGMTILQETDRGGNTQATAWFSDGSWVQAVGSINNDLGANMRDCFFGFVAPAGEYITQFHMGAGGGVPGWRDADDIGFITSVAFDPSSNAGPDQLGVQLWDASAVGASTGVLLDGSIALPIGETYTYSWSGNWATIDDPNIPAPTVTFTAAGTYVLTLNTTGSLSGALYADTMTIEVIESDSNAGSNQTVQLAFASTTGVTLDGSVDDSYDAIEGVENYTYAWSGGFTGGTTTGATPTVLFTATDDYILTLVVTGDVQGALAPDTVTISVVIPVLDAGDIVQVEKTIVAYPGVYLDSTLSDPIVGETYTYVWSSVPAWSSITDAAIADPVVVYPSDIQTYVLTLDVTSDGVTPPLQDTVTVNVVEDYVMVAHFAMDPGERAAAHYADSSTEGEPNNHTFITDTIGGSENHDGVVDCDDDDAIQNSNNAPLEVHLDHSTNDPCHVFVDAAPHLDNIDAAITVALWIKNDYGRKVWAIEKVGTFAFGIDDGGDLRTQLWFDGAGDPNSLTRSKDGSGLGDDLHGEGLKINADGAGGGHEHVWHHIAFTYDSFTGYVEQFLDGALIREDYVGGGKLRTEAEAPYGNLAIGRNVTDFYGEGTNDGLRGAIDDIRIYNYPLEYHEIAGLASMGQAATLVYAGADVTVDPNDLPYELSGRFIRLGQGVDKVTEGSSDPNVWNDPDNTDNDYYVRWEQVDPNAANQAVFSDPADPESDVSFPAPGAYALRLVSFERLCQSGNDDNDVRSKEVVITVLTATDCAGARNFLVASNGINVANIAGDDCVVGLEDLAVLLRQWMLPTLAP